MAIIRTIFSPGTTFNVLDPNAWGGGVVPGPNDIAQIGENGDYRATIDTDRAPYSTYASPFSGSTIVKNSGTTTGYINGVADGTYADSSTYICGTSRPAIGADGFSTVQPTFPGYISNLRAVKGIAVYTGNFTPPTAPLEATQSAGTNIAAITGTSTSLLTCQSYNFKDNSTNNFTITRNGDAKVTSRGPFTETETENNAMYFDGSGDYLTVPDSANFNFGTGPFSIEFWAYCETARPAEYHTFTETRTGASSTDGFGFGIDNQDRAYFYLNGFVATDPNALPLDQWVFLSAIGNGAADGSRNVKLYVNGTLKATWTTNYNFTSGKLRVGTDVDSGTDDFQGYIDDLRITKGVARTITLPTSTSKLK